MIKFKQSKKNSDNFSLSYNSKLLKESNYKSETLAVIHEILTEANKYKMRVQCIKKGGITTYYFYNINNSTIVEWAKDEICYLNNNRYLYVS